MAKSETKPSSSISIRPAPPMEPVYRIVATIRELDGSLTSRTVVIPVTE